MGDPLVAALPSLHARRRASPFFAHSAFVAGYQSMRALNLWFGITATGLFSACEAPVTELHEPVAESRAGLQRGDQRFGFVGIGAQKFADTFGTHSYLSIGNQNDATRPRVIQALEAGADPRPGDKVVVRVGLFNVRQDGYGQSLKQFSDSLESFAKARATCYANPFCWTKPRYHWFQPDVVSVSNIERPQIAEAIRRWRSKGVDLSDITFEIGNEPNYFVSMTPGEYAYLYQQYHDEIKRAAPDAKVAMGALFAFELMPQDARDRIAELIAIRGAQDSAAATTFLNPLYEPPVFLSTLGFSAVAGLTLEGWLWLTSAGERAVRDTKNLLFTRMFARSSTQYISEVLDKLPPDMAPDVISFHAYPGDFADHYGYDEINTITDTLANDLRALAYDKRRYSYPPMSCTSDYCSRVGPDVYITEMGNINPYVSEGELALRLYFTVGHLQETSAVDRWFWYKTVGQDAQFELLKSAAGIDPPFTRLTTDPNYDVEAPGPFPCTELNYGGGLYYYLATGSFCQ